MALATAPPPTRSFDPIEYCFESHAADLPRFRYESIYSKAVVSSESSQFFAMEHSFEVLKRKLDSTRQLQDGWDSYSAPSPSTESIESSNALLLTLKAEKLLPDHIVASAEGGIATYFFQGDKTSYVEYLNSGEVVLAMYDSQSTDVVELPFGSEGYAQAAERVRRYFGIY